MSHSHFSGRIACIGEAMVELTSIGDDSTQVNLGFAGDSLNTAIYLKRLLGAEPNVAFITRLGHDTFSTRMVSYIDSESIDTGYIERSESRLVGLYAIDTDTSGERTFSYWRNQSAARTMFQDDDGGLCFDTLGGFDVLYLSAITLAILPAAVRADLLRHLDALRQHGAIVAFDSNYRPALWESQEQARLCVADAWRITDIALPSLDDEMALFGDNDEACARARLHSYGITRGALKRGACGPVSLDPGAENASFTVPESAIDVIDTTAAGDSFNAGYLANVLAGCSDTDAMQAGHNLAARVIGHRGAIIPTEQW